MGDPEVEKRFAWGSPRLRAFAADRFLFEHDRRGDIDHLRQLWAEQRAEDYPREWTALFEFQNRFGGLATSTAPPHGLGIAWWLRDPKWFARAVDRANRRLKTWDEKRDARVRSDVHGRWLGMIRFVDLDFADAMDEDGRIFHTDNLSSRAYPVARDAEHWLEKWALRAEISAARPLSTGDCFIEVDRWIGEALAREASIPLVAEATDDMTRNYWDGTVAIEEGPTFGEPKTRSTRVQSADFDRVSAIALLAWPHLRGRDREIRVIGWPNEHTYGLQRRLAAEHPKLRFVVRTTYP